MPPLTDSLEQLNSLSNQIQQLSRCNCRPSGPYTTAYLGSSVVPDLIRDGSDAEKRLFKFIGETDSSIKKVEKREGLVTPLKDLKAGKARGGQGETDVVLRAVAKLVDDYRPMPRARAHIASLAERHEMQTDRIAALERQIRELRDPAGSQGSSRSIELSSPAPSASQPKPKITLSPDEAIKAEEESIRALEALIRPHPEAAIAAEYASPQKQVSPEKSSTFHPHSPPSLPSAVGMQTPARTPARERDSAHHQPGGTIFGATPHRSTKINRFTPLKNLATPRTRERGSIFGTKPRSVSGNKRLTSSILPPLSAPLGDEEPAEHEHDAGGQADEAGQDETIRLPAGIEPDFGPEEPASPTPDRSALTEEADLQATPRASPVKIASPVKGPRLVEGVLVDSEAVHAATSLISNTLSDLMSHGAEQDTADASGIVSVLHRVSVSEVDEVPSSGSSVASSAITGPTAVPVTKQAVLQAHLLLLLLRSPDLRIFESEAKQSLSAVSKERGWTSPEPSSIVWGLTGKKTLNVDRRGPSGPKGVLHFR